MATEEEVLQLLQDGEIAEPVLSPFGSNYTFLVEVRNGSAACHAVYKPRKGEVPLWDFPDGTLYKREYAAYLLSEILGWHFIPTTIVREGPYGIGSLQLMVDHDPRVSYLAIRESHRDAVSMIACFDLASNNADRKASHFVLGTDGKIWGIDHGLTFHSQIKVRTVVWELSGEPISDALLQALSEFLGKLESPCGKVRELINLLDAEEVAALVQRVEWLLDVREYPGLHRRRY